MNLNNKTIAKKKKEKKDYESLYYKVMIEIFVDNKNYQDIRDELRVFVKDLESQQTSDLG